MHCLADDLLPQIDLAVALVAYDARKLLRQLPSHPELIRVLRSRKHNMRARRGVTAFWISAALVLCQGLSQTLPLSTMNVRSHKFAARISFQARRPSDRLAVQCTNPTSLPGTQVCVLEDAILWAGRVWLVGQGLCSLLHAARSSKGF